MDQEAVPFQKILFVCINRREPNEACCAHRQSEAIAAELKARVKALGLSRLVRVSTSGCQDLCAKGPNVMVFPEYRCYHHVTPSDLDRIIQETVQDLQSGSGHAPSASPRSSKSGSPPALRHRHRPMKNLL